MIVIVALINSLGLGMAIGEGAVISDMASDWLLAGNFLFALGFGALAAAREIG